MLMCPDTARAHEKARKKREALAKKQQQQFVVQEWKVRWSFHGDPPEGIPYLLAEEYLKVLSTDGVRRGELSALYDRTLHQVPRGYGIWWARIERPPKRRTKEQRGGARRRGLERRTLEKYPLFAEQIIARELEEKADYYAGEKDTAFLEEYDRRTEEIYQRMMNAEMGMTIHWQWWKDE